MPYYINGLSTITTQDIASFEAIDTWQPLSNINTILAVEPAYKEIIAPILARRMAKGVKMGLYTGSKACQMAQIDTPDAIILGTGYGCIIDTEKFLIALIENNELYLTPTSFIQSTHNTVGGQIALQQQNKGYNMTYSNGAVSFESALLDALMMLDESQKESNILVGGIDELGKKTIENWELVEVIKRKQNLGDAFIHPKSLGAIYGEGATSFIITNKKGEKNLAEILSVTFQNKLEVTDLEAFILQFLTTNNLTLSQIDLVILGNNGAIDTQRYYDECIGLCTHQDLIYYKHLVGEGFTINAFALYLATQILQTQHLPENIKFRTSTKEKYEYILIYNQLNNSDHSLILIKNA